jgi:hypothetical protein
MGGKTTPSKKTVSCVKLSSKQRLWMFLTTKTSGYFWYVIDNFSCKLSRFAAYYEKSIGKEYAKEYTHVDLAKKKRVLHIGSGAYPLTGIILVQTNGVHHVVGIDNDPRAVHLAQSIVEDKQLSNRIVIEHAEGQKYQLKHFDAIIVSSCSWPKIDILEHVLSTAPKNSLIILRELNHATPPIVQCIRSHPDIKMIEQIGHQPFPFYGPFGWQSFYLLKT